MRSTKALFLVFGMFLHSEIVSHGFAGNTLIGLETNQDFMPIEQVSMRFFSGHKTKVATYKEKSEQWKTKSVQAVAHCTSEAYFELIFAQSSLSYPENIQCSPLQLFYRLSDRLWVAAHELREGDWLLRKNNQSVQLQSKRYVQNPITLYIIEVKKHHTFVVGQQQILTHNMFIPIATTIGMSIPFDIIFSAGSFGCIFGPVSFCYSVAVAGVAAAIAYQCGKEKHTEFSLRCESLDHYEMGPKNYSVGCGGMSPDLGCFHKATVEDLLQDAAPIENTGRSKKNRAIQYTKPGNYDDTLKDFEKLRPTYVKDIPEKNGQKGKVGILPDGRTVIARLKSYGNNPTLEIQPVDGAQESSIKIRYDDAGDKN